MLGLLPQALRQGLALCRQALRQGLALCYQVLSEGFLDAAPPADLVSARRALFAGVHHGHHYAEGRRIADMVPDATLRMTPSSASARMPSAWRELTGFAG